MKLQRYIAAMMLAAGALCACSSTKEAMADKRDFARGADVSWVTQMEAEGIAFTAADGTEMECMELLRDQCNVDAIRLRVWVNPADGWNNIDDVLAKCRRASALGMRLMIDFHFSDTWADPGAQKTPEAWANLDLDGLKAAMAEHVNELLVRMKDEGISPTWVQIGNETRDGMMYPLGNITANPGNFSELVTAGYEAVKAVFPAAYVIVHIDNGYQRDLYTHVFTNELEAHGAKYDMIGISLYPDATNWQWMIDEAAAAISIANEEYHKPVMVCEIGMDYHQAQACRDCISYLMEQTAGMDMRGIFYWEPEAPAGYNGGYSKGCFDNGTPTVALDAFK